MNLTIQNIGKLGSCLLQFSGSLNRESVLGAETTQLKSESNLLQCQCSGRTTLDLDLWCPEDKSRSHFYLEVKGPS